MVGAPPALALLQVLHDIFLVDQHQAVQAELLLAGGGLVVSVALVSDLVPTLAHVAMPYLHERNRGVLVEGCLLADLLGLRLLAGLGLLYVFGGLVHPSTLNQYNNKSKLASAIICARFVPRCRILQN